MEIVTNGVASIIIENYTGDTRIPGIDNYMVFYSFPLNYNFSTPNYL